MERLWWPFTFQRFSRDECFSSVAEEIVSQLTAIIFSLQWHKGFPFFTCHVGGFQKTHFHCSTDFSTKTFLNKCSNMFICQHIISIKVRNDIRFLLCLIYITITNIAYADTKWNKVNNVGAILVVSTSIRINFVCKQRAYRIAQCAILSAFGWHTHSI